jgi:hypothetical protein
MIIGYAQKTALVGMAALFLATGAAHDPTSAARKID